MPWSEYSQRAMEKYLSRISGPLIDRIDIHVEVPAVPYKQLTGKASGMSTQQMRELVFIARERQIDRQGSTVNSELSNRQLDQLAPMDEATKALLGSAISETGLSARAYDKIRRTSRTIADLEGSDMVQSHHVGEAVQYRLLDRVMV